MQGSAPSGLTRRGYLDWIRGLAVLVMIEAHIVDSWTAAPYRETQEFGWALIVGGFGAPLFLLLAGVSVVLSADAKARRTGDASGARRAVARRGFQIFLLAFLFRLQAVMLSWDAWRSLLKVDILNIMGPSIAAAAALWGRARSTSARCLAFAVAAIAIALLTPPVRAFAPLASLPDPIEGYVRPIPGLTNFVFFPWMAFLFAGAVVGTLIDATTTRESESRANAWLGAAGILLVVGGYAASWLPSPYAHSDFWTTSPAYFAMRVGLLTGAVAAAYLWELRPWRHRWSPMQQLGRSSLFVYWIHVEMVYGLMSQRLHRAMTFSQVWLALAAFVALMVMVSMVKDRAIRRFKGIRPRSRQPAESAAS